jgi:hypothetical protein
MLALYEDDSLKDVEFKLDSGTIFKAHRCVLRSSQVSWFKTLLNSQIWKQPQTSFEVKDCSDNVFKIGLLSAYNLTQSSDYPYEDIFKAASYFGVSKLIETCNFNLEFYTLAFQYAPEFDHIMGAHYINLEVFHNLSEEVASWFLEVGKFRYIEDVLNEKMLLNRTFTIKFLRRFSRRFQKIRRIALKRVTIESLVEYGYWDPAEAIKFFLYGDDMIIIESYPLKVGLLSDHTTVEWTVEKLILMNTWTKKLNLDYNPGDKIGEYEVVWYRLYKPLKLCE